MGKFLLARHNSPLKQVQKQTDKQKLLGCPELTKSRYNYLSPPESQELVAVRKLPQYGGTSGIPALRISGKEKIQSVLGCCETMSQNQKIK